ncbi:MAG: CPBP family intramembrane glutamic endopeptidase [Bacteroidaceae bacterium]|nr:CPBP family intramembrane glutamic endopeptidase [Bacteroidaceae bacterium]
MKRALLFICIAALLWFVMFSPCTSGLINFWFAMSASAIVLSVAALTDEGFTLNRHQSAWSDAALGLAISAALWLAFWIGDKMAQRMFSFADVQIGMIYDMGNGTRKWIIGLLLLFVIGPAEEIFWRGYVQRVLSARCGKWQGFLVTWLCYTMVHVWSGNVMLLLAAAACGFCWGMLYLLMPKHFVAIMVSHALWDVAAFILFPF